MKKTLFLLILTVLVCLQACTPKDEDLGKSDIDTSVPPLNATDKWLRANFIEPYNIEVLYKWNENAVDHNRYLYPPIFENVLPAMEAIKTIWLDTYFEVAGPDFVKKIAPREILLVGGVNLNPSGTITLGLAESGARVTFFNTDFVDLKNTGSLVGFVSTIQHEYTHILNQTVPFDEVSFKKITPSGYTAQWFNSSQSEARRLGFISAYARANEHEDFAEMVTAMLSNNNEDYNAIINNINSDEARAAIRSKETLVVNYFKSNFSLDIYELQRVAAENIQKVVNN
ncbi:MAG: putative zinc-binding metallopeptidase [Tenacibaculum sp.]